jgi:DUF971 family protein
VPAPQSILLHQSSRRLELAFPDGSSCLLPYELLRVYSPSAEVQGHGPGQEVLQVGKRDVIVTRLELVGHYGLKPEFSDGHDSGIYSWAYLRQLGERQDQLWQQYEQRLAEAGASRDTRPPQAEAPPAAACGGGGQPAPRQR